MSRKEICVNELFSRYETSFQSLMVRAVDKWKRKWKFHGDSSRLMVLLISTNLFDSHTMTYPFRGRKRQELDFVKRVKPIHTGESSEMKRAVCPV